MFFALLCSLIAVISVLCTAETVTGNDDPVVRLNHGGNVRGKTLLSERQKKPFYAFRGIPYAEPPVGNLRFKAPVPKATWENDTVLDATKDGPVCYQHDFFIRTQTIGQEDCLYLNVYTPEVPQNHPTSKKSVMVFIHGGGFTMGDGTSFLYPPERLMDSDIVLVTINYRMDALGFLSTGDPAAPGNYGLLDQILALQWVKDNIEEFGGDSGSVTIFGESAGGASVSYHLISPLSKGLFHRAIAMSGTGLSPVALANKPLFWAEHLASETNCTRTSTSAMVECLRSKPVEALVLDIAHYMAFSSLPMVFIPTVDGDFLSAPAMDILTSSPEKINNVPVMTGVTEMEGSGMLTMIKQLKPNVTWSTDEAFEYLFNNSITNQDINIIHMVKDFYLKNVDLTNEFETNKAIANALSDGIFAMNHYEEVQLLSRAGLDVYVYSYDFATTNTFKNNSLIDRTYGVSHGEDLFMLFNVTWFGGIDFEERDFRMVETMTQVWTDFAKTGNPDPARKYLPEWKPSTEDLLHICHLNLTVTVEDYDVNNDERFTFWVKDVAAVRKEFLKEKLALFGTAFSDVSTTTTILLCTISIIGVTVAIRVLT